MTVAVTACLLSFAWVIARIWRGSSVLAVASVLVWPVVLLALLRNWGDEESDIKLPVGVFGVTLACCAFLG